MGEKGGQKARARAEHLGRKVEPEAGRADWVRKVDRKPVLGQRKVDRKVVLGWRKVDRKLVIGESI